MLPPHCWGALGTLCPAGSVTGRCWQHGVTHGMWGAPQRLVLPTRWLCPQSWRDPPRIHTPHPQHLACSLSGASQGLGSPKPRGPIWPSAPGGPSLLRSGWRAVSSRNPPSAAQPLLPSLAHPAGSRAQLLRHPG